MPACQFMSHEKQINVGIINCIVQGKCSNKQYVDSRLYVYKEVTFVL